MMVFQSQIMAFACIRQFHCVCFFMERNIIYKHIVKYTQKAPTDKGPVVLDLGCCNGYPTNSTSTNVYGCDLLPDFIREGHKLYRDGPNSKKPTPIKFFADDIFDVPVKVDGAVVESGSFSLNNLRGKIDILYAGAFFHLFDEEKQFALAQRLVALINVNYSADRNNTEAIIFAHRPSEFGSAFAHSPESWKEMWETILVQAFGQGALKHVEINVLKEHLTPGSKNVFHHAWLWWSVTLRLPL
ncbi:hypothetical protein BYT27DRAFT_7236764 [Phlegmacium glaucopus]|nr:hypothetical protein BYT27DRAFT_7236764 [Phlegmacium glaucopus]